MTFDERIRAALGGDQATGLPPGFLDSVMAALPTERRRTRPDRLASVIVVVVFLAIVGTVGASLLPGIGTSPTPPSASAVSHPSGSPTPGTSSGLAAWTHLSWTETTGTAFQGTAVDIAGGLAWSGGYLLYGRDVVALPTGVFGIIWSSRDGHTWQREPSAVDGSLSDLFGGSSIVGVAAHGRTIVAVGQIAHATLGPGAAAIWTSHDGLTWSADPSAASLLQGFQAAGIAAGAGGFVLYGRTIGAEARSHASVLASTDGLNWVQATLPGDTTGLTVTSALATSTGFAAVGGLVGAASSGTAWWSTDGRAWYGGGAIGYPALSALTNWPGGQLHAQGSVARCAVCLGLPEMSTWVSSDQGRSWGQTSIGVAAPTGDTTLFDGGRLVRLQAEGAPWGSWSLDGTAWTPLAMGGATPASISRLLVADGPIVIAADAYLGGVTHVYVGTLDDRPGPVPTPTLVPGAHDTSCGPTPCGP